MKCDYCGKEASDLTNQIFGAVCAMCFNAMGQRQLQERAMTNIANQTPPKPEPAVEVVKSCLNCHYRITDSMTYGGRCLLSGSPCYVERQHPTRCGSDFSGWKLRQPAPPKRSLRKWIIDTFWKV